MKTTKEVVILNNKIIKLDEPFAKALGFTSDKFTEHSYLWESEDSIIISFIQSKYEGKGNLSALFKNILKEGFNIKVPTPSGKMLDILHRKGFEQTSEFSKRFDDYVEVWIKKAGGIYGNV